MVKQVCVRLLVVLLVVVVISHMNSASLHSRYTCAAVTLDSGHRQTEAEFVSLHDGEPVPDSCVIGWFLACLLEHAAAPIGRIL